jgi:GNAT superfamily N-acetyltransferase
MKDKTIIREIKMNELDKLLLLYKDLHDIDFKLPSPQIVESIWGKIQNEKNIKYFGLFNGAELISSCTIILVPNLTRSCRPYGVIENVVTRKEYRNNGLGKSILHKAIDYAWANNCYKIMLMTGRLKEETFRFYESVGFDRHSKQAFVIKK